MESFSLYSIVLEINFDEQDRSEIENAAVPLENEVTLSLRPTQISFEIEITHATITDALDENLFNLTGFLNTDFTDIVHASPGKISYAVVVIRLIMEHTETHNPTSLSIVLSLNTASYIINSKYPTPCFC